MRIIGGRFKGLGLTPVGKGDAAAHLRPTADRVRESLFSMLEGGRFGNPVQDAVVLDLFAGTGALGLEALSRGARMVRFVETGRASLTLLTANVAKAGVAPMCEIIRRDATRLGVQDAEAATLVFVDPPYGTDRGQRALTSARDGKWLAEGALVVWEDDMERPAVPGFKKIEARRFGQTWLTFLEVKDS